MKLKLSNAPTFLVESIIFIISALLIKEAIETHNLVLGMVALVFNSIHIELEYKNKATDLNKFDLLYDELVQISKEILPYYDIDKTKSYSVYIWTKDNIDEDGDNVFDILEDEVVFYVKDHIIIEEAKPIIKRIQLKLKEISQCS